MAKSALSDEDRAALHKWLSADRIQIDDDTRLYLRQEADKRGLTFGGVISSLLHVIADDNMAGAVLDE